MRGLIDVLFVIGCFVLGVFIAVSFLGTAAYTALLTVWGLVQEFWPVLLVAAAIWIAVKVRHGRRACAR